MVEIIPVLLAGGSGTRLWPLSRKSYPKQFSKLIGDSSLFQMNASRLCSSENIDFKKHITLTNSDYRFIVGEQLQEVSIDPGPIIIEPEAKNTAPAILAAALYAFQENNEAIILVAPSDHILFDTEAFHKSIASGVSEALNGNIVTFGITPVSPETGYGYLELATDFNNEPVPLKNFIEKPDQATAKKMITSGNYLWNSGIFLFQSKVIIEAFRTFAPNLLKSVEQSIAKSTTDLGFLRLDSKTWAECENVSIDYAVMERADNLVVVPFANRWSDLGFWDSVWKESKADEDGVVVSQNATALDCKNVLLRSESNNLHLVGLGLNDIIAIALPDAVLVAHRSKAHEIGKIVPILKKKNVPQAEVFSKDHRPWGWFSSLALENDFQVKLIVVKSGAALSLQSHKFRSEHWVVVSGTAKITVNDEIKILTKGQSVYIPLGAIHRLENENSVSLELIEVQTGSYLGEDDIVRYEDLYERGNTALPL